MMKLYNIMIVIVIIGINNGNNNAENQLRREECFVRYIDTFKIAYLPVYFDSAFYGIMDEYQDIPTNLVSRFVEDTVRAGGIGLQSIYTYKYVARISIDKSRIACIVGKIGGAAGIENYLYLITYDRFGTIIDNYMIGKEIGGCDYYIIQTANIDNEWTVHQRESKLRNICEGTVEIESITDTQVQIDRGGRIIK